MQLLRKLLFPFSAIYWLVTSLRNFFYDTGVFKSHSFATPIIAIGNLSMGGTGKTPQTEYLIRLLSSRYKIATLSRGYKRKTEGFVLGDSNANAEILGDEPYQFYSKFPEIYVAVDANRKNGIAQLLTLKPTPQVILLDDAYQHRKVKAGFYILLTAYGDLYADDILLPAGNLREGRAGAIRASCIVVTKCPPVLSIEEQKAITKKLKPAAGQQVYFTTITYSSILYSENGEVSLQAISNTSKVVVAGIAKPKPFFDHVSNNQDICLTYPDHHDFTDAEIGELDRLAQDKIIVTTEKDFMRLKGKLPLTKLFCLPIETKFLNRAEEFDRAIGSFVENTLQ